MLLSHLEVLSEVLVSAPPVSVDHVQLLLSADLMEVGVSHVVLLSVNGESAVVVLGRVHLVDLSNRVAPLLAHSLLL